MKRLLRSPPIVALPDTRGLLRRVPWLEPLSDAAIDSLLRHCTGSAGAGARGVAARLLRVVARLHSV